MWTADRARIPDQNASSLCDGSAVFWCLAGAITTLGRGGSDLTATLIGAALHVPEVQVWKDVDGAWTWELYSYSRMPLSKTWLRLRFVPCISSRCVAPPA